MAEPSLATEGMEYVESFSNEEAVTDFGEDLRSTFFASRQTDYAVGVLVAVAIAMARLALTLAFKPLAAILLPNPKKDDKMTTQSYAKLVTKFQESAWKMLIYSAFTCVSLSANVGEPWLTGRDKFWSGCTRLPCNYQVSPRVYFLYVLEIGFYFYSIPALVFWETRRKDFLASLSHHIATLILLLYSHYVNFTRLGAMVLLLHDCGDIFIELSKLLAYVRADTAKTVCFVFFTLLWISTRVVIYPLHVIRSTLFDSLIEAAKHDVQASPHYEIFNFFLIFLWVLNVYWTVLILRILYRGIVGQGVQDVREDGDSDDD